MTDLPHQTFADSFIAERYADVLAHPEGGWSARCPLCKKTTSRVRITREMIFGNCSEELHTGGEIEDAQRAVSDAKERLRTLEGVSLAELRAMELVPPKWLIEGFIEEGAFGVLFGPPNVGKTFLAIYLIVLAAMNGWKIKFIEAEGGIYHLRNRLLRAVAAYVGVPEENINIVWTAVLNLSTETGAAALEKSIEGYDLCVLDSMSALSGGVSENEEEWAKVSNNLAWARSRAACAILALHHPTKELWKPGETPQLRHLRGHGALAGRADFAFAVSPGPEEEGKVVFDLHDLKERDAGRPAPRRCKVDMVGPAANMTIETIDNEIIGGLKEKVDHVLLELVEHQIGTHPGITKAKLESIIEGYRSRKIRVAVDQLEHSSRIVAVSASDPKKGYLVTPSRTGLDGVDAVTSATPSPLFRAGRGSGRGGKHPAEVDDESEP